MRYTNFEYHQLFTFSLLLTIVFLFGCHKDRSLSETIPLNVPYEQARVAILNNDWQPFSQNLGEEYVGTTIKNLHDHGLFEVSSCYGTGKGYCRFVFQNEDDLYLMVITQEAPFVGYESDLYGKGNPDTGVVVSYNITDAID